MFIYTHLCAHTHKHTLIYTNTCTCLYARINLHIYTYIHARRYTVMQTNTRVYKNIQYTPMCTRSRTHKHTHARTFTNRHTHTRADPSPLSPASYSAFIHKTGATQGACAEGLGEGRARSSARRTAKFTPSITSNSKFIHCGVSHHRFSHFTSCPFLFFLLLSLSFFLSFP